MPWSHSRSCPTHSHGCSIDCKACWLRAQLPVEPCRSYVSVAVTIPVHSAVNATRLAKPAVAMTNNDDEEGNKDIGEADQGERFAIFSTQEPGYCPIVRSSDLTLLRVRDGVVVKSCTSRDGGRQRGSANELGLPAVLFIRAAVLCRDAKNEQWVIGHPFIPAASLSTDSRALTGAVDSSEPCDHEVLFDGARMAVAKLSAVVGAAAVHRDTSSVFASAKSNGAIPSLAALHAMSSGSQPWIQVEAFCCRETRSRERAGTSTTLPHVYR